MPNDLSIQAATVVSPGSDAGVPSKLAMASTSAAAATRATPSPSPSPNPTLQLDAALGLVVLEFRNNSGAITSSIPSQQQLQAYQQWQETRVGAAPQLGAAA